MAEETKVNPREELKTVAERITGLNNTRATAMKLMESGSIKIIPAEPPKEGEEPLSLDISGDIVQTILSPVLNVINRRKEEFLAYKENLLVMLEGELTPPDEAPKA